MNKKTSTKLLGPQHFLRGRKNSRRLSDDQEQPLTKLKIFPDNIYPNTYKQNQNQVDEQVNTIDINLTSENQINFSNTNPPKNSTNNISPPPQVNNNFEGTKETSNQHINEITEFDVDDDITQLSPLEPSETLYPSLRKRGTTNIEDVLKDVSDVKLSGATVSPAFGGAYQKEEKEKKEDLPEKEIDFSNRAIIHIFLVFDLLFTFLGNVTFILIVFVNTPAMVSNSTCYGWSIREAIKGETECDNSILYAISTSTDYILTAMFGLAGFFDHSPFSKNLVGMNGKIDRIGYLGRLMNYLKANENLSVAEFRIAYCSVCLALANYMPYYRMFIKGSLVLLIIYFGFGSCFNSILIDMGYKPVEISTFLVKGKKEQTSFAEDCGKDLNCKQKAYYIFQTFYQFGVTLSYGIAIIAVKDINLTMNYAVSLLMTLLISILYFSNVFVMFCCKKFLINSNIIVILNLFSAVFFVKLSPIGGDSMTLIFVSAHLSIFLATVSSKVALFDWNSLNKESHNTEEKLKTIKHTNYFFVAATCLCFSTLFVQIIVVPSNFEFSFQSFSENVVQSTVFWCADNIRDQFKNLYYNINMTEDELFIKVSIVTLTFPNFLVVSVVFYYIIGNRKNEFDHKKLIYFPYLFLGYIVISAAFARLLKMALVSKWYWEDVSELEIVVVGLTQFIESNDLAFVGCVGIFIVLQECAYDLPASEANEVVKPSTVPTTKNSSFFDWGILTKRILSTTVCLLILFYLVPFAVINGSDDEPFITISPSSFKPPSGLKFEKFNKCDTGAASAITGLVTDVSSDLSTIKSYDSGIDPVEVLNSPGIKILFISIPIFLVSVRLVTNLFEPCTKFARHVSVKVTVFCLLLSFPGLFAGVFIFPVVNFFVFADIYPFHTVVYSKSFLRAMELNGIVFFPPVVNLLENYLVMFSPDVGKNTFFY